MGFFLSCLYFFFQLSPYSFPYTLHGYHLLIFILIFIFLGVMTTHMPPDQACSWSLCTSSTVLSPRKCIIFQKEENMGCIPFPIPPTLFPLGICMKPGCQVVPGGTEVVPEGLWTDCAAPSSPAPYAVLVPITKMLKTCGGACEEIWGLCVFHALGNLACYWGQAHNCVFTCLASPPSRWLFSYQPIRISH